MRRGEIYYAGLEPTFGSEQAGTRPVLIIQNDMGNKHSGTTIVAPITGHRKKTGLPTHVPLPKGSAGLRIDSVVLTEQIRTIDKGRLQNYVGRLSEEEMKRVERALAVGLAISEPHRDSAEHLPERQTRKEQGNGGI